MPSLNKVTIIGHLGGDPELRYTQTGTPVANFTVATSEKYKDTHGNKKEQTEWHKVVAWQRLAEICGEYLHKGSLVYVEGKLQTSDWTDKEGARHFKTEIVARSLLMLGGKGEKRQESADKPLDPTPPPDDNVPF